ncbi:hypothetical protein CEXT_143041 [Caerostris extrusa]|uniref:Uncharacterized protein n=1 Tax=Caerostris extrusa TaxID=172846 RepID=A0AAV4TFA3_CAEEX|nr:hypothetical protein CEXT_143041 [Caerostris extrusa]
MFLYSIRGNPKLPQKMVSTRKRQALNKRDASVSYRVMDNKEKRTNSAGDEYFEIITILLQIFLASSDLRNSVNE